MASATDKVEIIEFAGVKIPADPAVLTPPIIETMRAGKYENARVKCLRPMVAAGDRIVDVGGGVGFISALMAREGRAALVVSIEGHPGAHEAAARLHRLNGVDVVQRNALVVTANPGVPTRPLYISRHFWGSSMLPGVKDQTGVVEVQVMTFGDVIDEYAPNMLVIDLEVLREYLTPGAESGPLEAMTLSGVNKVVVHLVRQHGGDLAVRRVFDFFSAQDFVFDTDYSRGPVVLFKRIGS